MQTCRVQPSRSGHHGGRPRYMSIYEHILMHNKYMRHLYTYHEDQLWNRYGIYSYKYTTELLIIGRRNM
jgi:hypothetical protein